MESNAILMIFDYLTFCRWVEVLSKAVRGEIEKVDDEQGTAGLMSPDESVSPNSFDSQEPDSSSST